MFYIVQVNNILRQPRMQKYLVVSQTLTRGSINMELISIKTATVIASNGVIACLITFMSVSKAFINVYKFEDIRI